MVQGSKKQQINTSLPKKGYGVHCVRRGLDFCHSPAKKGVIPMHGHRNVTPNPIFTNFLFPDTFWVEPYP